MAKATPEERFWAKVHKTETCWLWTGCISTHGYGLFSTGGTPKLMSAHRWVYQQHVGPIPAGRQLDHRCHNAAPECPGGRSCIHRRCVNPAHLAPATARENLLRGKTNAAANVAKTHCPRGHAYDEANTVIDGKGGRVCLACKRERNRLWMRAAQLRQPPWTPKTHCPQGHPYSPENTYRVRGRPGWRACKICSRERSKLYQRRRRARIAQKGL